MLDIRRLLFDKRLSQRDLAELIGEHQSALSLLIQGKRNWLPRHTKALIEHFGEDVINSYTIPEETIAPMSKETSGTNLKPEVVEMKGIGSDTQDIDLAEIAHFSLPFATNDIVQSREIDIRHLVETKSPKLEKYPIGQKLAGVSYAQRIITEAMIGADFYPGDVICLTYLEGKSQMLSGYAYLLDTKNYGALFRLVTINEDGTLLLESANPKFRAITLNEDEVRSYARLMMMIRTNFSFNRGAQFSEIVRNRDEQIHQLTESHKELISAQIQVLQNQAELIAEMRKQGERLVDERAWSKELTQKTLNNK